MAQELKPLNGLRFPACLLIFTQHLPAWSQPDDAAFAAVARIVMGQAQIAMPYFFVLSGFVLLHAYGDAIRQPGVPALDRCGVASFLARRLARLFPLHLLCLALILPWAIVAGKAALLPLLAHLTLTQALVPDIAFYGAYNAPSWSMSAELVFALAFAPLALLLWRLPAGGRMVLLLAALLLPALAAMAITFDSGRTGFFLLYINPIARLADFAAGMLLYLLWTQFRWRLNGFAWEALALAFFVFTMIWTVTWPVPYRYGAAFLPAILALTAVFAGGDGPVRRFLARDTMLLLGRLAFAFYMVHFVVIRYAEMTPLATLDGGEPWRWALPPLLALLALGGATAIHFGFERRLEPHLRAVLTRLAAGLRR